MVIVRHGTDLTLNKSVRLNEEGLAKLQTLGTVKNIMRIGAFHGRDDAFYRHHFPSSKLWALKTMVYENDLKADHYLTPNDKMPIPHCSLFLFETSLHPEGILHLDQEGGILISCDSIQNISATDEFYSEETAHFFEAQELVKPANISSTWLGATHTKAADFERLLKSFTFQHLLTAHGEPLLNHAFLKVKETINRVFQA
ncbi:MAG: hypothetical protein K2X53_05710 [Alphaproteobacteria bacterium]|nr:hypothetical protein [Alphaproteobacteria bacterium]